MTKNDIGNLFANMAMGVGGGLTGQDYLGNFQKHQLALKEEARKEAENRAELTVFKDRYIKALEDYGSLEEALDEINQDVKLYEGTVYSRVFPEIVKYVEKKFGKKKVKAEKSKENLDKTVDTGMSLMSGGSKGIVLPATMQSGANLARKVIPQAYLGAMGGGLGMNAPASFLNFLKSRGIR